MLDALLFGLIASSALVIGGGVIGAYRRPPRRLVAVMLGLRQRLAHYCLAFELFEESLRTGGVLLSAIGLLAGAATFVAADELLDRYAGGIGSNVSGFTILAAVTLDGIPENIALGVSLLQTSKTGAQHCSSLSLPLTGLRLLAEPWGRETTAAQEASSSSSGGLPPWSSPLP